MHELRFLSLSRAALFTPFALISVLGVLPFLYYESHYDNVVQCRAMTRELDERGRTIHVTLPRIRFTNDAASAGNAPMTTVPRPRFDVIGRVANVIS